MSTIDKEQGTQTAVMHSQLASTRSSLTIHYTNLHAENKTRTHTFTRPEPTRHALKP